MDNSPAVERPVDYSKTKFSIEALLNKPHHLEASCSKGVKKISEHLEDPFPCISRSTSPESIGQSEGLSTSRHQQLDNERRKRPRTAFTAIQIKTLEAEFEKNKYLSVVKRIELAKILGLSQQQLKVWYQNRRTKWKRKYANDVETMAQQYYSSLGIPGSRPMLIGDRLWIFNSPQDVQSNLRRAGVVDSAQHLAMSQSASSSLHRSSNSTGIPVSLGGQAGVALPAFAPFANPSYRTTQPHRS